ncbi:hypothetical protein ACWEQO_32945, partial [Streptomyces sp. NPDC004051]
MGLPPRRRGLPGRPGDVRPRDGGDPPGVTRALGRENGGVGCRDELGEWLAAAQSAVPVRPVERPRVVLVAGD